MRSRPIPHSLRLSRRNGVDAAAAGVWARLRVELHGAGRRVNVNDLWIAAVAVANGLPVVSQDDDFAVLSELGLLTVISV